MSTNSNLESKYIDGDYIQFHPTWDIEHAPRKAQDLMSVIPGEFFENLLKNSNSRKIVEIGCGAGGVLFHFSHMVKALGFENQAFGYDISPHAIELAQQNFGHAVKYSCSSEIELSDKVALILLVDILEHLDDPKGVIFSLHEKTNFFLLRIPLDLNLWNIFLRRLPKLKKELGHIHYYNYKSALKLLSDNHLCVVNFSFSKNFYSHENRKTLISKIIFPIRLLTSAISPKINSLVWGGNSLIVLAKPTP